jgi:hypothetical protein
MVGVEVRGFSRLVCGEGLLNIMSGACLTPQVEFFYIYLIHAI